MIKRNFEERAVLIFRDMDEISAYIIEQWQENAEVAFSRKNEFTVALSGGRTPIHVYRALAAQKGLPWGKTHIFMVDERFVPYESDENNFRMINESLLLHVGIPARNVHPIITSDISARDCAAKYEKDIVSFFKLSPRTFPYIDMVLLGIGEDGHTASLFPGTAAVSETSHPVVAVTPLEESKKERITMTLPVINNASYVLFLAAGESKAKILREILVRGNRSLPAARVKPQNGPAVFLVDKEAGSLLAGTKPS
jgi:6-phosphogluconolactonase